jgi:hypothetical protein
MSNQIKWIIYSEKDNDKAISMVVPICESCIDGNHVDYGTVHSAGELGRRDCKYVGENKAGESVQCNCNPDWSGLYHAVEHKTYGCIFDTELEAEKARLYLEDLAGIK